MQIAFLKVHLAIFCRELFILLHTAEKAAFEAFMKAKAAFNHYYAHDAEEYYYFDDAKKNARQIFLLVFLKTFQPCFTMTVGYAGLILNLWTAMLAMFSPSSCGHEY